MSPSSMGRLKLSSLDSVPACLDVCTFEFVHVCWFMNLGTETVCLCYSLVLHFVQYIIFIELKIIKYSHDHSSSNSLCLKRLRRCCYIYNTVMSSLYNGHYRHVLCVVMYTQLIHHWNLLHKPTSYIFSSCLHANSSNSTMQ